MVLHNVCMKAFLQVVLVTVIIGCVLTVRIGHIHLFNECSVCNPLQLV